MEHGTLAGQDSTGALAQLVDRYRGSTGLETADLEQLRHLIATSPDPWARATPLHVTASALVVHPESRTVLLRWHERQQGWLQVGGHGDPGESDPLAVAMREAAEETGLDDLVTWPDDADDSLHVRVDPLHIVVVPVTAAASEPAHRHLDIRFVFRTAKPGHARPENDRSPLRWLACEQAASATDEQNLRESLSRVDRLLG